MIRTSSDQRRQTESYRLMRGAMEYLMMNTSYRAVLHRLRTERLIGNSVGCDGSAHVIVQRVSPSDLTAGRSDVPYFMRQAMRIVCEKRWYHESIQALILSELSDQCSEGWGIFYVYIKLQRRYQG